MGQRASHARSGTPPGRSKAAERAPREPLVGLCRSVAGECRTPLAAALPASSRRCARTKQACWTAIPSRRRTRTPALCAYGLDPTAADEIQIKTVSGGAQKTPAQILAKLEDPKLARATRVKLLLEVVPELIEGWRPDKESGRSEAGNGTAPRSCAGCSRWRTSSVSSGSSSTTAQPSGRRVTGTRDSKVSCLRPRLRTTRRTLGNVRRSRPTRRDARTLGGVTALAPRLSSLMGRRGRGS